MFARPSRFLILTAGVLAAAAGAAARAADIHLKAHASVPGNMVHLADVAEIHGGSADEAARLGQVELFASSPQERYVTARQVREALLARGVDLRLHTVSGASVIELGAAADAVTPSIFARRAVGAGYGPDSRASEPAVAAVVRFLKSQVDPGLPWQVELLPTERLDAQARDANLAAGPPPAGANDVAVVHTEHAPQRGAIRPWLGKQQFVMRWSVAGRRQEGVVTAEIKLPGTVVVAARDLPRGTILQAGDLKIKAAGDADRQVRGFEFIEDAVGNVVERPVRAGQMIDAENVELPELVRRGERVSIVVNHGGVRVRTEGRARDSGKRGDVVMVESAARRNAFQAVVTGVKEVEISVGATIVTRPKEEGSQRL